jgi:hypothetical protein
VLRRQHSSTFGRLLRPAATARRQRRHQPRQRGALRRLPPGNSRPLQPATRIEACHSSLPPPAQLSPLPVAHPQQWPPQSQSLLQLSVPRTKPSHRRRRRNLLHNQHGLHHRVNQRIRTRRGCLPAEFPQQPTLLRSHRYRRKDCNLARENLALARPAQIAAGQRPVQESLGPAMPQAWLG